MSDALNPSDSAELYPGQATSLKPKVAGVLRIVCGRVWATQVGPHIGDGDLFLKAGDTLSLEPGQHWVIETLDTKSQQASVYTWHPVLGDQTAGSTVRRWLGRDRKVWSV
jgi:hypothetical protein